ncbi:alpha/beta fold hydrolase [Azospirillum agricola]|uniref:alpha/beta fold hydrolase n=1 Tax=Azospirillum agricola TaxID=1720247 RepID=UPI000A0F2BA8|nr:alpha/beta hydrolase [Azospirillum agricola]SMH37734.1 4,5:9,10-diseco-3-hydroxy-5,9,17-trioxoandrosta-1(10),2-diene-4-oate hydrolase [Azospirillum lipoferum]
MAKAPITTTRHTLGSGYEICVNEAGSGPAVVFIHGSGPGASGASNFSRNIDAFVDAGYRVLLPDLIGYGASSKPEGIDYTLALFTDTLHEALLAHGVDKATLVGNSLGGGIAIQMALDHPGFIDRLILMSPGCIEEREVYFAMPGIARMVSDFGGAGFTIEDQRRLATALVYDPVHVTDELVAERFAVARTQPKDVLVRMRTPNLAPRLGELRMPILGFWGLQDQFLPESGAKRFLEACDDARFMTFNRVGHWVQVERAREFNRYSIDFLKADRDE